MPSDMHTCMHACACNAHTVRQQVYFQGTKMWCSLSISNHMRLVDVHQVRAHSVTSSDAFHDLLDEFTLALDNFILVLDQFIVVALNVSERFVLAFDQLDKFTLIVDHFFLVVY